MERRRLQKLRESQESIGSGNIRQSVDSTAQGSDEDSDEGGAFGTGGFRGFASRSNTFDQVRASRDSVLRGSMGSGFNYGGGDDGDVVRLTQFSLFFSTFSDFELLFTRARLRRTRWM